MDPDHVLAQTQRDAILEPLQQVFQLLELLVPYLYLPHLQPYLAELHIQVSVYLLCPL